MGPLQERQDFRAGRLRYFSRPIIRAIAGAGSREPAFPADLLPANVPSATYRSAVSAPGDSVADAVWSRAVHRAPAFRTPAAAVDTNLRDGATGSRRSAVHNRSASSHALQPGLELRNATRVACQGVDGSKLCRIAGNSASARGGWQSATTGSGSSGCGILCKSTNARSLRPTGPDITVQQSLVWTGIGQSSFRCGG